MKWLIPFLLIASAFGQQTATDIIPTTSGLNLGHSNQRWNAFINTLNVTGTCTINGAACVPNIFFNPASPGNIGTITPGTGTFTTLGATTFNVTTINGTTANLTTLTLPQLAITGDVTGEGLCSGSLYSVSCNDAVKVSALCNTGASGALTTITCTNAADEYTAIRNYVLSVGGKGTFHIVDDMCSIQTWSGNPFNSPGNNLIFGTFEIRGNCPPALPHMISIDGTSTIGIPSGLWLEGSGTAIGGLIPQYGGTGNVVQGTYISACNPATRPCPNGGFVQQSGVINNIVVTGHLALVTMTGKPFTQSTTAINNIQQYRMIHIVGATGAAIPNNAAWVISDCNTTYPGGCASNPQTFNIAVPTGFQNCSAGTCGSAYLDTPVLSIGTGGGNGVFGSQINNLTVDCGFLPGTIGWVNAIGQELSGLHSVNSYNCTVTGGRIDQSPAYNGASFASSNSGDYGPFSANTQNTTCGNVTCACMGGSGNQVNITSFTGTTGTITFTTSTNPYLAGDLVYLSGFTAGNNGLNGSVNGALTVLSAGLNSTHFEAVVVGSGYSSAAGIVIGGGNSCSSFVGGVPGTVVMGTAMSVGAGTALATIYPDPAVNSNYHNFLFTGSLGQQGFGLTNHITATLSDKSAGGGTPVPELAVASSSTTNNYGPGGIAPGTGATLGCGMGFYGIHGTVVDYHHEYALGGICIGGDANRTGTFYYAYTAPTAPATAVITSSVQVINGFAGSSNFGGATSMEVDIGTSVADAPVIGDINIQGLNMQNGGSAIDMQNNVNGEICKTFGSAPGSDYVLTYQFGHSTTASNANAGLTGLAIPMRITTCGSLPAFVGNAFAVPMISTNAISTYGFAVKADTTNAGQFVVLAHTDGAGIPIGVNYYSTSAGGFGAVVTSGIVPMRFDTAGTGNCSTLGMFVIAGTTNDGRVQCTASYSAGTVIGKNLSTTSSTNAVVTVLVGLR